MGNKNNTLYVTPEQLDYMLELITLDLALSQMTLGKLQTSRLKERLALRINANKILFDYLKVVQQNETTQTVPANGS